MTLNKAIKILITGSQGFLARNLFESLTEKYSVTAPTKDHLNLLDSSSVEKYITGHHFDVILHCATYDAASPFSEKNPTQVLQNNLKMFLELQKLHNHYGKLIYFGSGSEFDRSHWHSTMPENYFGKSIPQDEYGLSKYVMNLITEKSSNIFNLRLFGVFGKYEDWRYRFISQSCCRVIFDRPISISADHSYDYLYINDVVKIVDHFILNNPKQHSLNICTGKTFHFTQIINTLKKMANKDIPYNISHSKDPICYGGSNALLLEEMPNLEFTDMENALRDLYTWYDTNKRMIDPSKL